MTFNFSDIIFKAQDAIVDSTGITLNGSGEEQMISLWQLIWGYDSMTDEYSLTSMIVMTLLFTFSIVAVYIFIERFLAVQRALKGKSDFMNQINSYVTDGKLDAAKQMCQSTDNPIARMVEKGLNRIGKPMKDITTSIENVGKLEISKLERRLTMLATISGVAPMLGFLGTVLGMVKVFQNMSKESTFEIASLSGGIMEAMITTVGGLIVGIVAYMAYNYLVSKVEKVIHNMEGASLEFLDILEAPGK
jgi:biopolymer transport protein ExbB